MLIFTSLLFCMIAILYSSVGHAGASGYLAIMALLSFAPGVIKPTSLILNIMVASIASYKFLKAGYFDKKIFISFVITSIPFSYFGGQLGISNKSFKLFAGIFLLVSASLLISKQFIKPNPQPPKQIPLPLSLGIGSLIGLFSGLIGVGGGIFLSPILILGNWTEIRKASGIAALFILVNSIAGFAGLLTSLKSLDEHIFYWLPSVAIGGLIGSHFGIRKFDKKLITLCLFLVLLSAGIKFTFID